MSHARAGWGATAAPPAQPCNCCLDAGLRGVGAPGDRLLQVLGEGEHLAMSCEGHSLVAKALRDGTRERGRVMPAAVRMYGSGCQAMRWTRPG